MASENCGGGGEESSTVSAQNCRKVIAVLAPNSVILLLLVRVRIGEWGQKLLIGDHFRHGVLRTRQRGVRLTPGGRQFVLDKTTNRYNVQKINSHVPMSLTGRDPNISPGF